MSPTIHRCRNCGSEDLTPLYDNLDYISGEVFQIARCSECNLVETLDTSPISDWTRYYDATYYGRNGRRFQSLLEALIRVFRHGRAASIRRLRPSAGRILDVGCGRGLMLAELQEHGWECVGTEANRELAGMIENRYGIKVHVTTDPGGCFPHEAFDVITLWHAFEHLQSPTAAIKEIHRLLKPRGILIIESPNFASLQARLGRGRWFHLDAPRHRFHFSAHDLAGLLKREGFEILRSSTGSLEYGYFGFYQTLLNLCTQQPNVLYQLLKISRPAQNGARFAHPAGRDRLITAAALPAVIALGTLLEMGAIAVGHGSIVRLTALRREQMGV